MSPLRIAADQFLPEDATGHRQANPKAVAYMIPGAIAVLAVVLAEKHLTTAGVLLTSTSILTGLTFTMTTTFWSKSIEARKTPGHATNAAILTTLDNARNHLLWTVLVGLASTGTLALTAVFAAPGGAPVPVTAVCAALVVYLLTLVIVAVQRFAEAALTLR